MTPHSLQTRAPKNQQPAPADAKPRGKRGKKEEYSARIPRVRQVFAPWRLSLKLLLRLRRQPKNFGAYCRS